MAELFANSGDPDQTPCSVASDLGLHCLPFYRTPHYNGLTVLTVGHKTRNKSKKGWSNLSFRCSHMPHCGSPILSPVNFFFSRPGVMCIVQFMKMGEKVKHIAFH